MGLQLFADNASTTLASAITASSTTLNVVSGSGSLFPAAAGGNWFVATLMHINSGVVTAFEIVQVYARSGDTFSSITRGVEGTSAQAWAAGDTIALLPTSGGLSQFVQAQQAQAQGYNYAIDVGSANAYSVTLTPPLTAHITGMPIRFKAGHANTGASTFNDGVGVQSLFTSNGSQLAENTIIANGLYEVWWDGAVFRLGFDPSGTALLRVNNLADVASAAAALATLGGNNASNLEIGTLAYARTGGSVSLGQNGWEKLPSGRIEQWGYAAATGTSPITVSFPLAFPSNVFNIQVTAQGTNATFNAEPVNNNEFEINTGSGTTNFYWRANGE